MAVDMLRLSRCLPVLAGMLVALPLMAGEEKYQVTLETNVAAKMRDGVVLRADIFRPKAEGKFPVLLVRNPYNKNTSNIASGIKAAERGYVFIHQDCRGRYASEGEWYPFRNESRDTFDTVEWAATLPYSNGKVGLIRGSYGGVSQLLGAIAQPPHLAGILPEMTAANYHDGWVYQGGAFEQWFNETWATGSLALDTLDREVRNGNAPARWAVQLPLSNYPLLNLGSIANVAPYFTDWLEHPSDDEYWNQISIEPHYDKILVPGYHVAGWYDIFQGGPIRNYLGIKNHGGSKSAQSSQHLLIGPWAHGGMGDLDFGASGRLDLDELAFRWYDYLLKGLDTGIEHEKPVKIFVMGKNLWREEDDWPLPRAHATNFYLHSAGNANSGAKRQRPLLQNAQQLTSPEGGEPVAAGLRHRTAVVDVDVGPAREPLGDLRVRLGVGVLEHGQRLVGEDDPEAERVGRLAPIVDRDLAVGPDLPHQDREVEPAGAAADYGNPHAAPHTPTSFRCSYSSASPLTTLCISASVARTPQWAFGGRSSAHSALSSS